MALQIEAIKGEQMQYLVKAKFSSEPGKPAGKDYQKTFGPFSQKTQAEACVVQLSGQAACLSATVEEKE